MQFLQTKGPYRQGALTNKGPLHTRGPHRQGTPIDAVQFLRQGAPIDKGPLQARTPTLYTGKWPYTGMQGVKVTKGSHRRCEIPTEKGPLQTRDPYIIYKQKVLLAKGSIQVRGHNISIIVLLDFKKIINFFKYKSPF